MEFKRFEVVESIAGRDKGNIYLISQIIDAKNVLLIDGKAKLISKPKRKKIKHIKSLKAVEDQLEDIFEDKSRINDGEIRKILKKYQKNS
jgi:ribosomal protein L14E/L6E/L27E